MRDRVLNECRHIAEGGTSLYPTEQDFAEEVLAVIHEQDREVAELKARLGYPEFAR